MSNDLLRIAEPQEVIALGRRFTLGLEHTVYLNGDLVYKRPNWLGPLWQPMDAETVADDFRLFMAFDIPVVPTILHKNPFVRLPNGLTKRVSYVMEQPFMQNVREVTLADLHSNARIRQGVYDLVAKAEDLHKAYPDRGVDFLGGHNWLIFWKAYMPIYRAFPGVIKNLFVCEDDEVLLCDIRLLNGKHDGNLIERMKGRIGDAATEIELGAIWELFRLLGYEPPVDLISTFRRLGEKAARKAMPKMLRYMDHAASHA